MAVKVHFVPEAEEDLMEAYAWYEDRRVGLGEEFLGCVDIAIQEMKRNPELFEKVVQDYRRSLLRRFPYAIFYEVHGGDITIYSVFHTAQDPHKWRSRLK